MEERSPRIALLSFLCAIAVACNPMSSVSTESACCFGLACGPCPPESLSLNPSTQQYLLLGDTIRLVASSGGSSGFAWSKSSGAVEFVRPPDAGRSSVTVRGAAIGSSTISLKRSGLFAATPIDVVARASLSNIQIARQFCAATPAILCSPRSGASFRDTVSVGDTVMVAADVKDSAGHTLVVNEPLTWSTSRSSVAVPGLLVTGGWLAGQYQFVVALSRGSAVITAAAEGLSSSFTLVVQ